MHDLVDLLLDKAQAPSFDPGEKDDFLNLARMEFVKERYSQFELTEKRRQDIANLIRSVRFGSGTATTTPGFMISQLKDMLFIVKMVAYFTDTCKLSDVKDQALGHDTTINQTQPPTAGTTHKAKPTAPIITTKDIDRTLTDTIRTSVTPVQLDDLEEAYGDPFNEPSDKHPLYVLRSDEAGDRYVQIFSDTDPLAIDVDYLTEPDKIDGENTPTGVLNLPVYTHEEIVNIAVRKLLDNIESPRYPNQVREIKEQEV